VTRTLTIATRGSMLALWQANHVKAAIQAHTAELAVELLVLKTQGDKILDVPLSQVGGKGLFVKEIEAALLDGRAQLAVHSMKDVPTVLAPGLIMAAVSAREDARDALVGHTLHSLPQGAHVGTSSLRRLCQLKATRPDLRMSSLRGNVDSRLRKLDERGFDAIVLATAGLTRLGHAGRIGERLSIDVCLPAIGQGALGLETRIDDHVTRALVHATLQDEPTARCVTAERALLARLDGGCQAPIAGHAILEGEILVLRGLVGEADGSRMLKATARGPKQEAERIGVELADKLIARGAGDILARARG
jgi:hydroxymethylbilane synthase